MNKLLLVCGGFLLGVTYGSWAASLDGPLPIPMTLWLGVLGLAYVVATWRLPAD
jgi:hypothetical protein